MARFGERRGSRRLCHTQGWVTRPDRPDLSGVHSSLLPDEPAREIFMAMQEDDAS
jgi:hypothetical protein